MTGLPFDCCRGRPRVRGLGVEWCLRCYHILPTNVSRWGVEGCLPPTASSGGQVSLPQGSSVHGPPHPYSSGTPWEKGPDLYKRAQWVPRIHCRSWRKPAAGAMLRPPAYSPSNSTHLATTETKALQGVVCATRRALCVNAHAGELHSSRAPWCRPSTPICKRDVCPRQGLGQCSAPSRPKATLWIWALCHGDREPHQVGHLVLAAVGLTLLCPCGLAILLCRRPSAWCTAAGEAVVSLRL
mmetsp:Transcript_62775/g.111941  ORF Transcript_62775/g.111941 Transcript_62775/m.111941 type:complete len:241 (+) Transcript_62775:2734-3456(+)